MSNYVSENILTFKRLPFNACSSYKIYSKEIEDDNTIEILLDEIPNPSISLDIQDRINLTYNEKREWQLRDEINGVNSASVNVYINHNQITTKYYTFNVKTKELFIHIPLSKDDVIEVEYGLDIIKYIHKTTKNCDYVVVPIMKRNHLIGNHTVL